MLFDEWGGGHSVVQDQNEELDISSTFQKLQGEKLEISPTFQKNEEANPQHRAINVQDNDEAVKVSSNFQHLKDDTEQAEDYPNLDDNDLSKNKAFEMDAKQAHNEGKSLLEETISSQEDNRSNRNKRERMHLGIQADLAKYDQLSRGKRAMKSQIAFKKKNKRKVKKLKQVGMKKERRNDLAKEKAKRKDDIKELRKQNTKMKKETEKLKKKKRLNKSTESEGGKNKSGDEKKCRNTDGCNEKWATFSSAALGPAAAIIKQVGELLFFNYHTFSGQFYPCKRSNHFEEEIQERRLLGGQEHPQGGSNSKPM